MRTASALALLALPLFAQSPLDKDRTGIRWVHPFTKALAQAKADQRMILLLPLAGGTNAAGDW